MVTRRAENVPAWAASAATGGVHAAAVLEHSGARLRRHRLHPGGVPGERRHDVLGCRDRRRVGPGTFGTFGSGGGPGRTAWARRAGGRAVVAASRDHADTTTQTRAAPRRSVAPAPGRTRCPRSPSRAARRARRPACSSRSGRPGRDRRGRRPARERITQTPFSTNFADAEARAGATVPGPGHTCGPASGRSDGPRGIRATATAVTLSSAHRSWRRSCGRGRRWRHAGQRFAGPSFKYPVSPSRRRRVRGRR